MVGHLEPHSVFASGKSEIPIYLTAREAAMYLRVSKSFLDKLRGSDVGPTYTKIGSLVRYRVDQLDAWMAARETVTSNGQTARSDA